MAETPGTAQSGAAPPSTEPPSTGPPGAGWLASTGPGPEAPSRREANKQATHHALQQAADRLFAEQGYAATTVRDIAEAAGVTERTFFRYFAGKEELIIDDVLGWLQDLNARIRARPASEDPVTAVRRSVLDLAASLTGSPRPAPLWLFSDGPPAARVISRGAPGIMLKIESDLVEVIRDRLVRSGQVYRIDPDYLAGLLGRATLALIRSVMIRSWQLRDAEAAGLPGAAALIDQAFSILRLPQDSLGHTEPPGAG